MFNLPNYLKHLFTICLSQNLNKVHTLHILNVYNFFFLYGSFSSPFFLLAIYLLKNELDLEEFFTFWIWLPVPL